MDINNSGSALPNINNFIPSSDISISPFRVAETVPTWIVITVTSCGFVGLLCAILYTNRITNGRHNDSPKKQERYCLSGDVTQEMFKNKSKNIVELLLRGGNLATVTTTGKSFQSPDLQVQLDSNELNTNEVKNEESHS